MPTHPVLRVAIGDYPHTRSLGGEVTVPGYELEVCHPPLPGAFRSMVREGTYDVCEMAMTTVIAARRYPQRFVALPVFLVRSLPFAAISCTSVTEPQDLHGSRVGIRAITGTGVFWVRGILSRGYGLDQDRVTWVATDEDYIAEVALPDNVAVALGRDLREMLTSGEVAAAINAPGPLAAPIHPLFEDAASAARRWLGSTGIYPLNHAVVVASPLVEADPELPQKLFHAFEEAKAMSAPPDQGLAGIDAGELRRLVGEDLLAYGIRKNRRSLESAVEMAVTQGILARPVAIEELFAPGLAAT